MVAGQDDSGWNYDGPRITERLRTQDMVRSFVTSNEFEKKDNPDIFEFNQRFWNSWKGRIVRAIVLDGIYSENEILKITKLKQKNLETALRELFQAKLLEENNKGFRVTRDVYKQCWTFFGDLQDKLVDWVQTNIDSKTRHFFLSDMLLTNFTENLMKKAKHEILVLNPFVERCHICKTLMTVSENGINVHLIARHIKPEQFKRKFLSKGISYTFDEAIHAKVTLVDRSVGIVSSMNFFPKSVAGGSLEAGLVTIDENVVHSILSYIRDVI